mgnify:CR=1 FL=1
MSSVLFGRECRANYKIWLIFAAVLTMYSAVIVSMFDPKLGESLNLMAQSMPELFAAFGMASPGVTMLDFLVNYLYGFLYLVFPLVLVLLLVNRLLARYLERGAMAWLLAAPHPRRRIAASRGPRSGALQSPGFTSGDLRQILGSPPVGTSGGANWRDNRNYVRGFGYRDE